MENKNNVIIFLGVFTMLLSILFQKNPYILISVIIYGMVLFILGFYYNSNKYSFWATVISIIPWVGLVYFQFIRRLYYLVIHGGERPNGMGSPLLFIMGLLFELPFLIGISYIGFNIYKDIRNKRIG